MFFCIPCSNSIGNTYVNDVFQTDTKVILSDDKGVVAGTIAEDICPVMAVWEEWNTTDFAFRTGGDCRGEFEGGIKGCFGMVYRWHGNLCLYDGRDLFME
jgi:hypothetical protein